MSSNGKSLFIRSGAGEFLIYETQEKPDSIQVRYHNETLWMTQAAMAELFDCSVDNVALHLKNIYADGELQRQGTSEESSEVRREGNRQVRRRVTFYNLDAIISVGYRVNSKRATQFRRWATRVLREFTSKGYALDQERMENGQFLGSGYSEKLLKTSYEAGGFA